VQAFAATVVAVIASASDAIAIGKPLCESVNLVALAAADGPQVV